MSPCFAGDAKHLMVKVPNVVIVGDDDFILPFFSFGLKIHF